MKTNEFETLLECCCLTKKNIKWQDTVWEGQLSEARDEHDRQEIVMDQPAQPDTDVPGVWRCQIEPKSDLYGDKRM